MCVAWVRGYVRVCVCVCARARERASVRMMAPCLVRPTRPLMRLLAASPADMAADSKIPWVGEWVGRWVGGRWVVRWVGGTKGRDKGREGGREE